jgi:hypothetical protein
MRFLRIASVSVVSWFSVAWYLMLGIGVVHHSWLPAVPAIGYLRVLPIALLLNFILDGAALRATFAEIVLGVRNLG